MKQYLPENPQWNIWGKMRITQDFWERPEYYKKYWLKGHEWIDINSIPWISTPIFAVFDWNTYFKSKKYWRAYWNQIKLYDDKWIVAIYCHIDKSFIKKGQRVRAGDLIGMSGNTSSVNWMALHLHFMIKECNSKTWIIYNSENWYFWSIKTEYDKKRNKLFFNTKKEYFETNYILESENLKEENEKLKKKNNDISQILKRVISDLEK